MDTSGSHFMFVAVSCRSTIFGNFRSIFNICSGPNCVFHLFIFLSVNFVDQKLNNGCVTGFHINIIEKYQNPFDQTKSILDLALLARFLLHTQCCGATLCHHLLVSKASLVLFLLLLFLSWFPGFSSASYLKVHIKAHQAPARLPPPALQAFAAEPRGEAQMHTGPPYFSGRSVEGKQSAAPCICHSFCSAVHCGGGGLDWIGIDQASCLLKAKSSQFCILHVCKDPCC